MRARYRTAPAAASGTAPRFVLQSGGAGRGGRRHFILSDGVYR